MKHTLTPPITTLGSEFYDEVIPFSFKEKTLRYKNEYLFFNKMPDWNWDNLWSFPPLPNNLQKPLALKYHGHQFHHYNPDLGDGRGFLYAQLFFNNQWYDLGTKGSGTTPYSRSGDGCLTLKGAMREALATEMLEALQVDTSKTACFFETGDHLIRNDEPSPTRSAVLTRLSRGHIRIGTFQRLAYFKKTSEIKKLILYVMKYYFGSDEFSKNISNELTCDPQKESDLAARLFQNISNQLALTCAQVMMAGFVHGVLNSDNINVSGELFDYGPYRFLPTYNPQFTAAYFDHQGLYAYGAQPAAFLWNLHRLAECFLFAFPELPMALMLELFEEQFHDHLFQVFEKRLNIKFKESSDPAKGLTLFFKSLEDQSVFFEEAFYYLQPTLNQNTESEKIKKWKNKTEVLQLQKLIEQGQVINTNLILPDQPVTLLIDEIESIWSPIAEHDDWTLFNNKVQSIKNKISK